MRSLMHGHRRSGRDPLVCQPFLSTACPHVGVRDNALVLLLLAWEYAGRVAAVLKILSVPAEMANEVMEIGATRKLSEPNKDLADIKLHDRASEAARGISSFFLILPSLFSLP